VQLEIYVVHTPTNAIFINLVKSYKFTLKYTIISLLHVSVFNDHHQGALSVTGEGKSVPLKALTGPEGCREGCRKLWFPDFMTTAQNGGKVVNLTHRPPLPPGNAPGTHFCYRLIRPQGHSAIGRILCR